MDVAKLGQTYAEELFENVLPFWMEHSIDRDDGGYYTCLKANGAVFDTDKFIWLQARQVWTFSMLFNQVDQKPEWLDCAMHGARFLEACGRADNGDWYFALDKKGNPLVQPYNIFSDCFATMAFGQLFKATGEERFRQIAQATFQRILQRKNNPKGKYNKLFPGTRKLKSFALPMILSNLVLEIEAVLPSELVESTIGHCIQELTEDFYNPELGLLFEHVGPEGNFVDSFEGRLINPGHAIEASWFLMDLAERNGRTDLMELAVQILLNMLTFGWDVEFGGIFYFLDVKGNPPQQLEWDQKLWWVHAETLVALLKGYLHTHNSECRSWFEKVHAYTWEHFPDPVHGEWYGYLNRRGEVSLQLKGGKWKGCFHVPRSLFQCSRILARLHVNPGEQPSE